MLNNQLMQLVPQIVSTSSPPVPVVHPKKAAPWPIGGLFELGLNDVQYNGDPILVVVADNALVRVCCIGSNHSIAFRGEFGWLVGLYELDYGGF